MYRSIKQRNRNVTVRIRKCVGMSKNFYYESPYNVTGIVQHTGLEGELRVDGKIGISERGKVQTGSDYPRRTVDLESVIHITSLY